MAEHARISRHFAPLTRGEPGSFGLIDDAAVLNVPPGQQLVVTTDSVIVGTHVPGDATPEQVATKLMRRNLSDLAAMGATPWRYLLNLHVTMGLDDGWFARLALRLREEQDRFGLILVGGDSTSGDGPVHATMTCLGLAPAVLPRNGVRPGDGIYVSGSIGDAALAWHHGILTHGFLAERYHAPEPRLRLGQALLGVAHAAIDISDGLLADASRLAIASDVEITVARDKIPLSPEARLYLDREDFWSVAMRGDDYELCFAVPEANAGTLDAMARALKLPLTRIGVAAEGRGLVFLDEEGNSLPLIGGYEHR